MNAPISPVNSDAQDGQGPHGFTSASQPVYAPNSAGSPVADAVAGAEGSWESDGTLIRSAATLNSDDDDFGQAGSLYRDVYDDAAKQRFLETLTGAVGGVKSAEILERALQYWTKWDASLGEKLRAELARPSNTANEQEEFIGVE